MTETVTDRATDSVTAESAPTKPSQGIAEDLFQQGIDRYNAGEDPKDLIPIFKGICDRAPKSSASWTCLAWLYLLSDQANLAVSAAKKAVKHSPHDAQARVNLAAALVDSGQKGVRAQVDIASQILMIDTESHDEVLKNLEDGLDRKPDSKGLQRVKAWLFES